VVRVGAWLLVLIAGLGAQTAGWQREMLAGHNAVRARVGLSPLVWSNALAAVAQSWADSLLARGRFTHQRKSPYGENLFEIRGGEMAPAAVVNEWAAEAAHYDYRRNRCRGECGHCTQMVWRGTREVGCGLARGKGREIWVCEYNPPGNFVGQRPY